MLVTIEWCQFQDVGDSIMVKPLANISNTNILNPCHCVQSLIPDLDSRLKHLPKLKNRLKILIEALQLNSLVRLMVSVILVLVSERPVRLRPGLI